MVSLVKQFFDHVNADRLDEARRLVDGSVISFPLYRTDQPVIRGAVPVMERIAALRARGVVFAYDHVDEIADGYVLARGAIRAPDHSEPSIVLLGVSNGRIVTVEAHQTVDEAMRTVRALSTG